MLLQGKSRDHELYRYSNTAGTELVHWIASTGYVQQPYTKS